VSGLKLLCNVHLGSFVGLIFLKLCPFLAGVRNKYSADFVVGENIIMLANWGGVCSARMVRSRL
jgi:hypothetical protein